MEISDSIDDETMTQVMSALRKEKICLIIF